MQMSKIGCALISVPLEKLLHLVFTQSRSQSRPASYRVLSVLDVKDDGVFSEGLLSSARAQGKSTLQ